MLKLESIFLCDEVEEAQHGKVNYLGVNPTELLYVSQIPYKFVGYIVVTGKTDSKISNLILHISLKSPNKIEFEDEVKLDTEFPEKEVIPFIFPIKTTAFLNIEGVLAISVLQNGKDLLSKEYKVKVGNAPLLKNPQHLPQSQLFADQTHDLDFVKDLLGNAISSIRIFDSYVDPQSLIDIFSKVGSNTEIKILTSQPHGRNNFDINRNDFLNKYPRAELKISRRSHDRFLIVNETECFHFGQSLKDVAGGRLSRFSKITRKSEVDELKNFFDAEW